MCDIIEKVTAYITWRDRLLVFRQPAFPEAGVQVPAGTVEAGEDPREAVLREAREETGLQNLQLEVALGRREDRFQNRHGVQMVVRRHYFHLRANGQLSERWRHWEMTPSGGATEPILFELWWASLHEAGALLNGWYAAFLHRVAP